MQITNFNVFGGEDQEGIVMQNPITPITEVSAKEMVDWFSGVTNASADTYYPVSHTFIMVDRFGVDESSFLNMSNKTNAFVKYVLWLNYIPVIMIKGGTVTGQMTIGQFSANIGPPITTYNDLKSTS
jgi:hypothetical protein